MLFSFSATILGNDTAIDAYRKGKQSFPDGSVLARLAWNYVPSAETRYLAADNPSLPDLPLIATLDRPGSAPRK
jgi:hypothetical protein